MPLPWKKSKSGRISRFVSDLQQSPKHGGSLVVETGFPTSLIDLFVKNRDRLRKSSSKRNNSSSNNKAQALTAPDHSHRPRRRVSSPPPPPPLQRRMSLPQKLDPASVTEDPAARKIEESFVGGGGLTAENRHDDGGGNGGNRGGGGCVLMVVVIKVFVVAVLALSTKRLAVGITISAFALLFLELAVARVFTLLNLCPGAAQVRLDSLIGMLVGKRRQEKLEESPSTHERKNKVSFEIIESFEESRDCIEEIRVPRPEKSSNWDETPTLEKAKPVAEGKKVQTIRDVVFTKEKSRSAKLKSKIVKKIVPKKLRSYKKKKKLKIREKEEVGEIEIVEEEGEEEEETVTEVSSLYSEERLESEISERDETGSNPPLLESCEEAVEEEEEESGSKGDLTKAIVLIVIALTGLLSGKVIAIGLTVSWCLILRVVCCKSQPSL